MKYFNGVKNVYMISMIVLGYCCSVNSHKQAEESTENKYSCYNYLDEEQEIKLFGKVLKTNDLNSYKNKNVEIKKEKDSNNLNMCTDISRDNFNYMVSDNNNSNKNNANHRMLVNNNNDNSNNINRQILFNDSNNFNCHVLNNNNSKISSNYGYASCTNTNEGDLYNDIEKKLVTYESLFAAITNTKESVDKYCNSRDMSYVFSEKEFVKFLSYVSLYFCSNENPTIYISSAKKFLCIVNKYFNFQNASIRPFVIQYIVKENDISYNLSIWQSFLWYYFLGHKLKCAEYDIYREIVEVIFKNIVEKVRCKQMSERILVQLIQSISIYKNHNTTFEHAIVKFLQEYVLYLIIKYPELVSYI